MASCCFAYPDGMTQPSDEQGEILISGLDIGPDNEERDRPTRTERLARLSPAHDEREPEDEDG